MQITGVIILIGLSIVFFVVPEKTLCSIPVRQADQHMIGVPGSGAICVIATFYYPVVLATVAKIKELKGTYDVICHYRST
jgi:hypothetical protein